MDELAKMLEEAQASGGPGGANGEGFPGMRGGPSSLPPGLGGPGGFGGASIPAAFGKKKRKK
jgi:hypothetical protein